MTTKATISLSVNETWFQIRGYAGVGGMVSGSSNRRIGLLDHNERSGTKPMFSVLSENVIARRGSGIRTCGEFEPLKLLPYFLRQAGAASQRGDSFPCGRRCTDPGADRRYGTARPESSHFTFGLVTPDRRTFLSVPAL